MRRRFRKFALKHFPLEISFRPASRCLSCKFTRRDYSDEPSGLKIDIWELSAWICSISIKHLKNIWIVNLINFIFKFPDFKHCIYTHSVGSSYNPVSDSMGQSGLCTGLAVTGTTPALGLLTGHLLSNQFLLYAM